MPGDILDPSRAVTTGILSRVARPAESQSVRIWNWLRWSNDGHGHGITANEWTNRTRVASTTGSQRIRHYRPEIRSATAGLRRTMATSADYGFLESPTSSMVKARSRALRQETPATASAPSINRRALAESIEGVSPRVANTAPRRATSADFIISASPDGIPAE